MNLYILEEHHEAFIAWHHALKNDAFQAAGKNTLLHVDRHADLGTGPSQRPIPELSDSLDTIRDFTYGDLKIGWFIMPAVYQKLFYEIVWLVPKGLDAGRQGPSAGEQKYLYARTLREERRLLIVNDDPYRGFSDKPSQDRVPFCLVWQNVERPFCAEGTVVLDIDMDYFACNELVEVSERLEITEAEYRRCRTERYRLLNLCTRYVLEESAGRHYICFNPRSTLSSIPRKEVPRERISGSIVEFIGFLKSNSITPAAITLSRSRYSGYTPEAAWPWIEEELVQGLKGLYPLEVLRGVDDLR